MAQIKDLIVTGASRFLGNIYGTLKGNADTSTKATQDSAGQQINTTYIKGLSVSGRTITYTKGDGSTGTITTQDTNTTYGVATSSANGLMSSADKSKLDGIAAGANNYSHPTSSGNKHIPAGGSSGQILRWSADGTAVWGADNNTTYSANTGIKLNGTTFQHTNSVTAATAQGDASKTLTFGGTFTIPTITYDAQGHITGKGTTTMTMPANPNTDTHWTTGITAGETGTTSNSATTNGNTFIKIKDNSTHRGQIKLVGSGATSVSSNAEGVITISSTDNNTTYGSMSVDEGTTGTATTNRVLTAANLKGIINAHAPTKTGGGASGTWGISISGNAATASKVNNKLTVGSKSYDGSAAVAIEASDLGLASAMLFLGTTTTAITDGATTNPVAISGSNKTVTAGNVVLYGSKEFVWTGSAWEELGNEGSYKIVQAAVADPSASGTSNTFIDTISQDTNGKITATKKTVAVTNSAPTLAWSTTSTVGTVAGTNLQVKMPANPNTDTKVTQTAINAADYTNWRPLIWGASNNGTEGFTPSTVTDGVYTAQTLSCQPATGTIRANTFKGNLSGNANTATNADQLDGIHANGFLRYSLVSSLDANGSLIGNCFYVSSASIANSAHTNHAALLNVSGLGTPFQLQIPDSSELYVYKRWNSGGSWSGWTKISAGYADSAGNADTLDGYHESSFLRYSGWWYDGSGQNVNDASGMIFAYGSHGLPGNWGVVTTFDYSKNSEYRHQIYGDGWNNEMYFRTHSSDRGGWGEWRHLLDNVNYTGTLDGRYVKKSGDTMSGPLTFANGTCNVVGDDCGMGDINNAGTLAFQGKNGTTNLWLVQYGAAWSTSANHATIAYDGTKVSCDKPFYGAVWNDYAEYRETHHEIGPGRCVIEVGDGSLTLAFGRLQPGANIVSDTFGFAIGETEINKTPLAVSGRVLAYPNEPRESYHAGDPVCSGPNGTISRMTREEVREWPDRIVGTVSEIPSYETWGTGNVKVDGRIWIKVK